MVQFLYNAKAKVDTNSSDLSLAEIKMAERRLLRIVQREVLMSARLDFKTL
jgi:hypothetical protein